MSDFVIGITGASGSIYGIRLIHELSLKNHRINVIITSAGRIVMQEELGGLGNREIKKIFIKKDNVKIWDEIDFSVPFISGSNAPDAVIVIPCSMGSLSSIANGISGNVLERAADVVLKERKQLILVIRETPLSLIHIENMLKAAKAGALILPAMPAFYNHPKTVDDMVNFVVGKVLNILSIEHKLFKSWGKNNVNTK